MGCGASAGGAGGAGGKYTTARSSTSLSPEEPKGSPKGKAKAKAKELVKTLREAYPFDESKKKTVHKREQVRSGGMDDLLKADNWGKVEINDIGPTRLLCDVCGVLMVDLYTHPENPFYVCRNCQRAGRKLELTLGPLKRPKTKGRCGMWDAAGFVWAAEGYAEEALEAYERAIQLEGGDGGLDARVNRVGRTTTREFSSEGGSVGMGSSIGLDLLEQAHSQMTSGTWEGYFEEEGGKRSVSYQLYFSAKGQVQGGGSDGCEVTGTFGWDNQAYKPRVDWKESFTAQKRGWKEQLLPPVFYLLVVLVVGWVYGRHFTYPFESLRKDGEPRFSREDFSFGLFDGFSCDPDYRIFCCSCFCLPIRWADTASSPKVKFLGFWPGLALFALLIACINLSYGATVVAALALAVLNRQRIRNLYGLPHKSCSTFSMDTLTWLLCGPCAAMQEALQVEFVDSPLDSTVPQMMQMNSMDNFLTAPATVGCRGQGSLRHASSQSYTRRIQERHNRDISRLKGHCKSLANIEKTTGPLWTSHLPAADVLGTIKVSKEKGVPDEVLLANLHLEPGETEHSLGDLIPSDAQDPRRRSYAWKNLEIMERLRQERLAGRVYAPEEGFLWERGFFLPNGALNFIRRSSSDIRSTIIRTKSNGNHRCRRSNSKKAIGNLELQAVSCRFVLPSMADCTVQST
eukprot:g21478.t1